MVLASQIEVITCWITAGAYSVFRASSGDCVSMIRISPRVRPLLRISLIASAVLSNDSGTQYSAMTFSSRLPGCAACIVRFM
ncbi:hypothetical protein D3C76_1750050 [compost metagenome]